MVADYRRQRNLLVADGVSDLSCQLHVPNKLSTVLAELMLVASSGGKFSSG